MDIRSLLLAADGGTGTARLARLALVLRERVHDDDDVRLAARVVLEQLFRSDAGTRMLPVAAATLARARARRSFAPGAALFIDLVRAACLARLARREEAGALLEQCRALVRPVLAQRWAEVARAGPRAQEILDEIGRMEACLDAMADDLADEQVPAAPAAPAAPLDEERLVLVVDDDADVRESVGLLLAGSGFRVLTADNGADAVALVEGGARPDAILLDLMMPVMNGWDFYTWQRRSPVAATPTLLYTAADLRPGTLGALRIVPKTSGADALVAALASALAADRPTTG